MTSKGCLGLLLDLELFFLVDGGWWWMVGGWVGWKDWYRHWQVCSCTSLNCFGECLDKPDAEISREDADRSLPARVQRTDLPFSLTQDSQRCCTPPSNPRREHQWWSVTAVQTAMTWLWPCEKCCTVQCKHYQYYTVYVGVFVQGVWDYEWFYIVLGQLPTSSSPQNVPSFTVDFLEFTQKNCKEGYQKCGSFFINMMELSQAKNAQYNLVWVYCSQCMCLLATWAF